MVAVTAIVPYRETPAFGPPPRHPAAEKVAPAAAHPASAPALHDALPATAPRLRPRPAAPFLAQLIAADHNLPQARERRRAEPRDALAAYAATAARN